MTTLKDEILIEQLKDSTTKRCNLLNKMDQIYNQISDIQRTTKPSKTAKAYIEEEEAKLLFMQDLIKRCVWEAYANDPDIVEKSMHYGTLRNHFEFEVIVRQKT